MLKTSVRAGVSRPAFGGENERRALPEGYSEALALPRGDDGQDQRCRQFRPRAVNSFETGHRCRRSPAAGLRNFVPAAPDSHEPRYWYPIAGGEPLPAGLPMMLLSPMPPAHAIREASCGWLLITGCYGNDTVTSMYAYNSEERECLSRYRWWRSH